jgi:REP element-mobilizing transposase RayT
MDKFKNKYRIQSTRLKDYDYSRAGFYFITICTKDRVNYFGKIIKRKMCLSEIGEIVEKEWKKTAEIRKNIKLDKFVIMPNHFHGILEILDNEINRGDILQIRGDVLARGDVLPRRDVLAKRLYAYKQNRDFSFKKQNLKMSKISPIKNSIPLIIRFFKRQTTIQIRKINKNFQWQSRFHDRIIRNENALNNIRFYIKNNPKRLR